MKTMPVLRLQVLAILITVQAAVADPPGQPDLSAIDQIPDLVQTDPKGEFARGGKSFCAPVSVSNSLVWIKAGSRKKFTDTATQYDVVNLLASAEYMNTDPVSGNGANGVMRGVRQFVENDIGDKDFTLAYQGWRSTPKNGFTGIREPKVEWIRSFVGPGKSAWINLGWYRHDKEKDEYERVGGHWVTVVGHGADEKGAPDNNIIVIHDPSPRTGEDPNDFVLLTLLEKGTITGKTSRYSRPARGLYLMGGGMHIKSTADLAIIDGVVGLDLNPTDNSKNPASND